MYMKNKILISAITVSLLVSASAQMSATSTNPSMRHHMHIIMASDTDMGHHRMPMMNNASNTPTMNNASNTPIMQIIDMPPTTTRKIKDFSYIDDPRPAIDVNRPIDTMSMHQRYGTSTDKNMQNHKNKCIDIDSNTSISMGDGKKNNKDVHIKNIQRMLIDKGYMTGTTTGYFGVATREAIKQYQKDQGIPSTGTIGVMTRNNFKSACADDKNATSSIMMNNKVQ